MGVRNLFVSPWSGLLGVRNCPFAQREVFTRGV